MACSTDTSLEHRIERLDRQLAAARWRARWVVAAAGCAVAVLACRAAAVSDEKSLRQLTIGNVRIDEFGITIVDPLGKTELMSPASRSATGPRERRAAGRDERGAHRAVRGHALRVIADSRAARTETETVEPRPDAAASPR